MEYFPTILVVDDDVEIRQLLVKLLAKYRYNVFSAGDGNEMFRYLETQAIDLVVLDVMLPGKDGLSLCRQLRSQSTLPILILTAVGDDTDRIIGLEIGADDYMAKPFNPRELVARIKAILRRTADFAKTQIPSDEALADHSGLMEFEGWQLDTGTRTLQSPEGVEISVSTGEYILLTAFLKHPQQVLSRDQLLDFTQNRPAGPFDRSIDVQVSRLRQKIEADPKKPQIIKTVRGGGYLFTPKVKVLA